MAGYERSRYHQRSKNRKKDLLLNTLIGVVALLIIIVAASIFFSKDDEQLADEEVASEETNEPGEVMEEENQDVSESETETETPIDSEPLEEDSTHIEADAEVEVEDPQEKASENEEAEVENEVINTIVNPDWQPIGTVQEGEHYNVYEGVDWDEMVHAITYAIGKSKDEITIHFLGNNGPNKSVGTVYTKNKEEVYKVYIEWVDNQGWKPTLVEVLAEVPKQENEEELNEEEI